MLGLQDPQEFYLDGRRDVADFVQKDIPPVGRLKPALAMGVGPGKGALDVAEELAFQQGFVERGAIAGDEGPLPPPAQGVDGVGHQFLAGAALAEDDHRGLALGGLLGEVKDLLHAGGFAHHTVKVAGSIHELGELLDLFIPAGPVPRCR